MGKKINKNRIFDIKLKFLLRVSYLSLISKLNTSLIILFLATSSWNFILGQNRNLTTYDFNDGLPTQSFYDAVQDTSGRIWFACKKGLTVYDGYEWKFLTAIDGIPVADYIEILKDEQGRIWASPNYTNKNIIYKNNDEWIKIPPVKPGNDYYGIKDFAVLSNDNKFMIVAVAYGGIYIYDGDSWIDKSAEIPDNSDFNSLKVIGDLIYISTSNGLFHINIKKEIKKFPSNFNINNSVLATTIDKNNNIILFTNKWLGIVNDTSITKLDCKISIPYNRMHQNNYIEVDNYDNLYFGNDVLLFHFDQSEKKLEQLKYLNRNNAGGVKDIFIDREQNKWFLDTRGVSKLKSTPFKSFFESDGLLENEVTAIEEFPDGKLVLGHNTGLTIYDRNDFHRIKFKKQIDKNVLLDSRTLDLELFNNQVWIAASKFGLGLITNDLKIKWLKKHIKHPYTTLKKEKNNLFISRTNSLSVYDNKFVNLYNQQDDIHNLFSVRELVIKNNSTIYLAEPGRGITKLNGDKLYKINSKNVVYNNVYSLFIQDEATILAGTTGGLCKIEDSVIVGHTLKNLTITNPIYFIEAGNKPGSLWFGLDKGVIYWDDGLVRHYDPNSGLAGYETNRHAGFLDNKGNFWIGTDQGLSMFPVGNENVENPKPLLDVLYIEDMLFEKYPLTNNISLEHDKNSFSLHFRCMSFYDEENVTFHVKLLDLDGEIIEEFETKEKNARFTNILSGDYQLSVKAKNPIGVFSKEFKSNILTIEAPFYKQSWFYILITSSLIIVGVIIQVIIFQRRYGKRLEIEVKERTKELEEAEKAKSQAIYENIESDRRRISRDLHDYLGQILTSAKLKLETFQFKKSVVDEQFEESLDLIQNTGKELRKIVHNLHPLEIEKYGLAVSVEMICNDVSNTSELKVNFINKDFCCEIDKQSEVMIYRIVQEALNNALKHSCATEANVIFEQIDKKIFIEIFDNGKGFDVDEKIADSDKAASFGLVNMKQRATLIGAEFFIYSKPGMGTKIKITLGANGKEN